MEWDGKTLRTQTWSKEEGYQDQQGEDDAEVPEVPTVVTYHGSVLTGDLAIEDDDAGDV
jgi:hypothetical protein